MRWDSHDCVANAASSWRLLLTAASCSTDIAGAYENSSDADQELVLNLAIFLTNFLSAHVTILETPSHRDVLLNAHLYLIKISQVEEREIFKICLEYWAKLVADLYDEMQKFPGGELAANPLLSLGGMSGFGGAGGAGGQGRRGIYTEVLSNLRLVMVERMAKPEEVRRVEGCLTLPRRARQELPRHVHACCQIDPSFTPARRSSSSRTTKAKSSASSSRTRTRSSCTRACARFSSTSPISTSSTPR